MLEVSRKRGKLVLRRDSLEKRWEKQNQTHKGLWMTFLSLREKGAECG